MGTSYYDKIFFKAEKVQFSSWKFIFRCNEVAKLLIDTSVFKILYNMFLIWNITLTIILSCKKLIIILVKNVDFSIFVQNSSVSLLLFIERQTKALKMFGPKTCCTKKPFGNQVLHRGYFLTSP